MGTSIPKKKQKQKQKQSFITSLAAQLSLDPSLSPSCLLSLPPADFKELLLNALSLKRPSPHDRDNDDDEARFKFLQRHLDQPDFISALQEAIRDFSSSDADALKHRLLQTLSSWLSSSNSPLNLTTSHLLSSSSTRGEEEEKERIQLLLRHLCLRSLPVHIIWSAAALELMIHPLSHHPSAGEESATLLLTCLKPFIIEGHFTPPPPVRGVGILGLAPLVPVLMHSLRNCSTTSTTHIAKLLLPVVKEVLAFISVICKNARQEGMEDASEKLSVADLRAGFSSIFLALHIQAKLEKIETPSEAGDLKVMFPLVPPELVEEMEKSQIVEFGTLCEAVKVQFVLLKIFLEVIWRRERASAQDKLKGSTYIQELSKTMGIAAVNGVALVDKGKDLILDVLLSNLYAGDILDGQEIDLIQFLLYKSVIISDKGGLANEPMRGATDSKALTFLKKVMVAHKMVRDERLKSDDSQGNIEELVRKIDVPYGFMEQLKSAQTLEKLPESILQSDQAVIGWLLQLGETELHGLAEATSGYTSQPKKHLRVKEPETNRLKHSLDLGDTFREAERLFFMDTTGENGDNADEGNLNSASDTRTSERKSSRKRKERQILFRRHGQLMNKEEDEKDDIVNTNSSSDEMVSDAEVFEVKRPKEDIALAC